MTPELVRATQRLTATRSLLQHHGSDCISQDTLYRSRTVGYRNAPPSPLSGYDVVSLSLKAVSLCPVKKVGSICVTATKAATAWKKEVSNSKRS